MPTTRRRKKEISEKTLELNVCAEILQCIRLWPDCDRALWLGLTQAQERSLGIDERIRNVRSGVALMLQFKAPWATSPVGGTYRFSINEQQHFALQRLAVTYPDSVYYVFPLYSKWVKADSHAPNLAQDTWLVPVQAVPPLPRVTSTPSEKTHRVDFELRGSDMFYSVPSIGVAGPARRATEFCLGTSFGDRMKAGDAGIPIDLLWEWWSEWSSSNSRVRFKGLNTLFIPGG